MFGEEEPWSAVSVIGYLAALTSIAAAFLLPLVVYRKVDRSVGIIVGVMIYSGALFFALFSLLGGVGD